MIKSCLSFQFIAVSEYGSTSKGITGGVSVEDNDDDSWAIHKKKMLTNNAKYYLILNMMNHDIENELEKETNIVKMPTDTHHQQIKMRHQHQ